MGLSALNTALTGLRVTQQQIGVISANISNASTPGYTRKILPQQSFIADGQAIGVQSGAVIRNVDLNLERDLWTQVSAVEFYGVQESYLSQIERFHGPPDAEISVSAELSRLFDNFAGLSDNPNDPFLLQDTVNQAQDVANKINDLANLLTTLRNDAQTQIQTTVTRINDLMDTIANINLQITEATAFENTSADFEDRRDVAVKELAGLLDIDFYVRGDNVMVVETKSNVELVSTNAFQVTFDDGVISSSSYYPESINGIFVKNPDSFNQGIDITTRSPGGTLGGLIEIRDTTLPKQIAQLDELAHKMASRFDSQGLRLFSDISGTIPEDTDPDLLTDPPTPVPYIGFAARIQVNTAIVNDNTLLRTGTYGDTTIQESSNEVIRRVVEFSFGEVAFQQIYNPDAATSIDLLNRGGDDIQTWLGLSSSNTLEGGRDLAAFASPADLISSTNGDINATNDTFRITIAEPRSGLGPVDIDISLIGIPDGVGNFTQDLLNHINTTVIPGLAAGDQAALTAMGTTFSEDANGEFVINTEGSIVIDAQNPLNPMGQTGLNYLGLVDNVGNAIAPTDPYFDIQVGNNDSVRITIEPGDTHTELLAKLEAVDGVAVDTVNFAIDGILRIRPGNDFDNPGFGGDIKITGGPFSTEGGTLGSPPAASGRTNIDDGVGVVSALFGTYSAGPPAQDGNYIFDIDHDSFRTTNLGPGASISTNINGTDNLRDFGQRMVYEQTSQLTSITSRITDEDTLRQTLETQFLNESSVNIDEELSNLIIFQTAYSAAARVVSAVEQMFTELLNAVR